jgi:thymidylate synthase
MNNIEHDYLRLLKDILDNGVEKQDRTGTGTISVFGRQIRHKMSEGFPLLTTKKMPFKTIVTELLWFLQGNTNIKFLVDNNCHIWDGDAYKRFQKTCQFEKDANHILPDEWISMSNDFMSADILTQEEFINKIKTDDEFAKKWGDLGPVYGKQWRNWGGYSKTSIIQKEGLYDELRFENKKGIDQIQTLINDLKNNPDSRRLMVNAWNVGELDQMVLPPCHYGFQVYTRELSLEERLECLNKIKDKDGLFITKLPHKHLHELFEKHNIPTRAISLMWNQRSVDTFLGLPFNIASYGLLLEIIAKEVNMVPDELIGNLGDVHLYSNHIEQAKGQIGRELSLDERNELLNKRINVKHKRENCFSDEQFEREALQDCEAFKIPTRTREPYPLPILIINDEFWNPDADLLSNLPHIQVSDFYVDNYQSHPTIKAPLSN